jgi:hypothetical protein
LRQAARLNQYDYSISFGAFMSMTVWLNVRTGDSHESTGDDLSALFNLQEQINALASTLGVKSPADFFDDTDVRYNMGEDESLEESEEGWPTDAAKWHDASEVLVSAQALVSHLRSTPDAITEEEGWTQDSLIEDLDLLIPGLERAKADGKQVHLLIVM